MNTSTVDTYNAKEHLVTISTKQGPRPYLPASWRLYELNLRYPDANFTSEILYLDPERDQVAVKVRLFLGPDFDLASKKTEALKSGAFTALDKVETACKARCARDFGISTELALDIEEVAEPVEPAHEQEQAMSNGHNESDNQTVSDTLEQSPASPQQLETIGKLAKALGRRVKRPKTYQEAKQLITSLSDDYELHSHALTA